MSLNLIFLLLCVAGLLLSMVRLYRFNKILQQSRKLTSELEGLIELSNAGKISGQELLEAVQRIDKARNKLWSKK